MRTTHLPCLSLLFLTLATLASAQQTFFVAPNGSDATGDGSSAQPWASLSRAALEVPSGATVLVRDGVYLGAVRLNRRFTETTTFRAEHPYRVRLVNDDNNQRVVVIFGGANIVIKGFEITRPSPQALGGVIMQVQQSGGQPAENITIRDNIFHDSYNNDLLKVNNNARHIIVEGNVFYNQQGHDEHIDVNGVVDVIVRDNIFFNDFVGSGRVDPNDTGSFIVIKNSGNLPENRQIRVRRNVFLHWESSNGSYFVLVGEDSKPFHEAEDVVIENNLVIGDSPRTIRAPFEVKGARDITFRNNTITGNLPANAYVTRLNREGSGPPNEDIRFYNNIWSDPSGTMNDFSDGDQAETASVVIDNNLYWNGGLPIPSDGGLLNVSDDPRAIIANPALPPVGAVVLPRWAGNQFASGSQTIRQEFERLVLRYGVLPPGSVARDKADPARAPSDDILGRSRGESPDLGAFEVQPAPEAAALVDAAAFTGQLAPGSLASIFGQHLSDGTATAAQLPLPQSLAGVSVMLGGKPAPLLFVSPDQINLQIHYDDPDGATVTASRTGLSGPGLAYPLSPAAPRIFILWEGQAAIQHSLTGQLVMAENPARPGDFITIFCTGLGQLTDPLEAGMPAKSAVTVTARVRVLFQSVQDDVAEEIPAEPLYAGLAVGFAGLNQVNVAVPPGLAGTVALVLEAAGASSPAVPLWAVPGS